MDRIRIMIADGHPMFRDGVRALLNSLPDTEVVGEAESGQAAVDLAAQLQPDVILMDIKMAGLNGIEATRRIASTSPHVGILMLTMFDDNESVFAAMRAGARGYLLKGAHQDAILRGIQAVANGEIIFAPEIARMVMDYFATPKPIVPQLFPELTEREVEVLTLVAQGYSNAQIAERLFLSSKTVRNHVSDIYHKLQVADRAQAIIYAIQHGVGSDSI